jgi:hypothetical protein
MNGVEGSPATGQVLFDALFQKGKDGMLAHHHQAFLASIAGKARLEIALTNESAFVLTHAAIGLLRAAAAEKDLGLDPAALEDELVRLMEAYVAALAARPSPGWRRTAPAKPADEGAWSQTADARASLSSDPVIPAFVEISGKVVMFQPIQ